MYLRLAPCTGVFKSWDEVKLATGGGYHRPKFKRFRTREAADKWYERARILVPWSVLEQSWLMMQIQPMTKQAGVHGLMIR